MIDEPRKPFIRNGVSHAGPYVWTSWITKLIAGEAACWFAAWYRAHNKYVKQPDNPERQEFFKTWTAKHDALVRDRAEELKEDGYVVKLEEDNAFTVVGRGGDLAGKPDITAQGPKGPVIVSDGKAGRPRDSDHWQVLVYKFGLALTWLRGREIIGEVEYADHTEKVRPLQEKEREAISRALGIVTGPTRPEPEPSPRECERCDILNCPARVNEAMGDGSKFF